MPTRPAASAAVGVRRRATPFLGLGDRRVQARRRRRRRLRGDGEIGQLPADQPVQPAEHGLGLVGAARQAGGARHQPRLLADLGRRACRPRRRRLELRGRARRHAGGRAEAARRRRRRRRRAAADVVRRAADEGAQIDLGQDVALQEEAVGLVVRLFGEERQLVVDHRLQQPPGVEAERRAEPRGGDDAREDVRAQDVVGVELLLALEVVHPRAQVGEFPRRPVHHRQRQARAEDLVLDGVVVDQAQLVAAGARRHARSATAPRAGSAAPCRWKGRRAAAWPCHSRRAAKKG